MLLVMLQGAAASACSACRVARSAGHTCRRGEAACEELRSTHAEEVRLEAKALFQRPLSTPVLTLHGWLRMPLLLLITFFSCEAEHHSPPLHSQQPASCTLTSYLSCPLNLKRKDYACQVQLPASRKAYLISEPARATPPRLAGLA
eukprot:1158233-Pelagomonas_calceolata.AAC.1